MLCVSFGGAMSWDNLEGVIAWLFLLPVGVGITVLVLSGLQKVWELLPDIALGTTLLLTVAWWLHKVYGKNG